MTKSNARELAIHLIYGREFTDEEPNEIVANRLQEEYYRELALEDELYSEMPTKNQIHYLDTVVTGVANRSEELNQYIKQFAIGWDISRISRLTKCIMQLSIYEIMYMDDIPVGVAISEAVRIAKKYDGEDTGAFVNGILGSFARFHAGEHSEEIK